MTVSGQVDPSTGMVCNLVDLDQYRRKGSALPLQLREFEYAARICANRSHYGKSLHRNLRNIAARPSTARIWKSENGRNHDEFLRISRNWRRQRTAADLIMKRRQITRFPNFSNYQIPMKPAPLEHEKETTNSDQRHFRRSSPRNDRSPRRRSRPAKAWPQPPSASQKP